MFKIKHRRIYNTITNYHINDENLSLSAKGLMTWFLCDVNDWDGSFDGILKFNNVSKNILLCSLNELQENGYIELNEKNDYVVNEKPVHHRKKIKQPEKTKEVTENTAKANDSKNSNLYTKCVSFINRYTDDVELQKVLKEYLILRLNPGVESRLNDRKLKYFNQWRSTVLSLDTMSGDKKRIVAQSIANQWAKFVDLPKVRDDIKSGSYTQEEIDKFRQRAKEIEEKGGKGIF